MCISPIIFRGLLIPCGKCIQCRRKRISEWSCKGMCEMKTSEQAWFITLTYNEQNYPEFGCLDKSEFQKFMKRFRKSMEPIKIRFIGCGEYGDKFHRPHYHLVIFLKEKLEYDYIRQRIEKSWNKGFYSIKKATGGSVRYVCKYCAKDSGEFAAVNGRTGEVIKPFILFSRRPGIGSEYYARNWLEMFARGSVEFENSFKRSKNPKGVLKYAIPQSFKRKFRDSGSKVYRHDYSLVYNDLVQFDKFYSDRSETYCKSVLTREFDYGKDYIKNINKIPLSAIRSSFDKTRQRSIEFVGHMALRGKNVKMNDSEKSIYYKGHFSSNILKYPCFIINKNLIKNE